MLMLWLMICKWEAASSRSTLTSIFLPDSYSMMPSGRAISSMKVFMSRMAPFSASTLLVDRMNRAFDARLLMSS
ncbi:hypothetical protein D3C87_1519510 [compost metagenome]